MNKINIAILGATGLVGQQFINILTDHPFFSIRVLTASEKNSGKLYKDAVNWKAGNMIPEPIHLKKIDKFSISLFKKKKIKIVFSALPSSIALEYETELRNNGFYVFSNASTFRMDKDVPIIIPEVNPDHLQLIELQKKKYSGFILTNPNCSTTGIVSVLKPLMDFGLESVYISTYQSISGGGLNGVSSFDILNNIIPFIANEEQKIEVESKKILSTISGDVLKTPDFKIISNCCRVPILYSHLISMIINLEEDVSKEIIEKKLSGFSNIPKELKLYSAPKTPLMILQERDRPQPSIDFPIPYDKKSGMVIKLGRLEKIGKTLKLFILFNNTIRGAAGTSVLNAELALKSGLIGDTK